GAAHRLGGDRRGDRALLRLGRDAPLHHERRLGQRLVRGPGPHAQIRLDALRALLRRELPRPLPHGRGHQRAALDAAALSDRGQRGRGHQPGPDRPLDGLVRSDRLSRRETSMRILVTGASGLIGCHATAALLRAGHAVAALVRSPEKLAAALAPLGVGLGEVEVVLGDLDRPDSIRRGLAGCDGLLHGAGLFSPRRADAPLLERTNVAGTRAVLEAGAEAAAAGGLARIVHLSSILALFPPPGAVQRADDPIARPASMYAITKARAEAIAREIQGRAPLTIVYPAAVQGPDDPTFSIGPRNVATALRERW